MTTEVQHQPIVPVDIRNKSIENKSNINIPDPRLRSRMIMKENQMKRQMSSDLGIFTSNGINPPKKIRCVGNYDIRKTIGRGSFGKVKISFCRMAQKLFFLSNRNFENPTSGGSFVIRHC